jgi:hypothetical protein
MNCAGRRHGLGERDSGAIRIVELCKDAADAVFKALVEWSSTQRKESDAPIATSRQLSFKL